MKTQNDDNMDPKPPDEPDKPSDPRFGLLTSLLDGIFKNLPKASKPVRNVILVFLTLLFAVLCMHAFMAPSFVQGTMYYKDTPDGLKKIADGYFIRFGDYTGSVNSSGSWIVPVSCWPGSIRIAVQEPYSVENSILAEFNLFKFPAVSSLGFTDHNATIIIHRYKQDSVEFIASVPFQSDWNFQQASFRDPVEPLPQDPIGYYVHLEGVGDVECNGTQWCGAIGQGRKIEGFTILPLSRFGDVQAVYMGNLEGTGDTAWLRQGVFCGTHGKRLEGFAVRLEGADASRYSVAYQAHIQTTGNTAIVRDGTFAGTRGSGLRIEAIRIWIEPRP